MKMFLKSQENKNWEAKYFSTLAVFRIRIRIKIRPSNCIFGKGYLLKRCIRRRRTPKRYVKYVLFRLPCDYQVVWATMMGNECFMITIIYIYIYIYILYVCVFVCIFHPFQLSASLIQKNLSFTDYFTYIYKYISNKQQIRHI